MKNGNTYALFISIVTVLCSKQTSAAHFQYEACAPINCAPEPNSSPNVSFPFHVPGRQEPYCGLPGFELSCSTEVDYPVLRLPESEYEYVVEQIYYRNRSFHVYNAAVLRPERNGNTCPPGIQNTTLPVPFGRFDFAANTNRVYLFSGCPNPLPDDLVPFGVSNCDFWDLAIYEGDWNLEVAEISCRSRNVVLPVGGYYGDEGRNVISNVTEVLRAGFELSWTASDCGECEDSGGRCGFNVSSYHFRCFCPDRPHSRSCKPSKLRVVLIASLVSGGGVLLIVGFLFAYKFWQHKKRINQDYLLSRSLSFDPSSKPDIEGGSSYFGIPIFSYTELEKATNNFDPSKELGDGGFGTVYYGKLLDGREVAIKRLYEHNYRRVEQFMNEIKILTCLRHKNLVSLYGCTSRRSRELLLVYEYISNGTVAEHLHGERPGSAPLSWPVRLSIALETADALAYLHKSDIIHRDVKTCNILLDANFCVKVADFGLSRLFPNNVTHISTAPQGTPGYVDPDYHQCYQLTDKSDVYSFGVVLIELISSLPAVDITRHRHEINLANLAVNIIQRCAFDELIDKSLGYDTDSEVARMTTLVAELAFRCLQLDKDMRPSMDEVVEFLNDVKGGEDCRGEKVKGYNGNCAKIPPSPEADDAVLLKSKKSVVGSPNAVIHSWVSSSSAATSSVG